MDPKLLEILVCPLCKGPLVYRREQQELICRADRLAFPIRDDIPVMLEEEARPLPVPPAAESRREEAREEEKREEMPMLAGEVPEEVRGSLLYIERLVTETAREEVERAVERKRRLYSMAKGAGMPDAIARLVVYMFNLDEVEQMVAVYRQMPDSHAFIKMLAERVDSFRSAKSLTVSDETLSMLGEIANTYAYPLPFLVQDIVRAVYTRFSTGEYKTLRELLDAVAGRGA